jgi:hypothetical protein
MEATIVTPRFNLEISIWKYDDEERDVRLIETNGFSSGDSSSPVSDP